MFRLSLQSNKLLNFQNDPEKIISPQNFLNNLNYSNQKVILFLLKSLIKRIRHIAITMKLSKKVRSSTAEIITEQVNNFLYQRKEHKEKQVYLFITRAANLSMKWLNLKRTRVWLNQKQEENYKMMTLTKKLAILGFKINMQHRYHIFSHPTPSGEPNQ